MTNQPEVVRLPWGCWSGDGELRLRLPTDCEIDVLSSARREPLTAEQIAAIITSPTAGPPLRQIAEGAGSACIAVDDLARPTRGADVLPSLLREIAAGGVPPERTTIVIATGSHAALSREEAIQKVGREVFERYRVTSHDCRGEREPLADSGVIYGDQPLRINAEFLAADVKVVVGSVLPHSFAGYSGGAKLVLPGLSDLTSLARSHKFVQMGLRGGGDPNENGFRTEAEQIAVDLGLSAAACVVPGDGGRTVGLAFGDPVKAHRSACRTAAEVFRTPIRRPVDCLILNAWPKDIDLVQSPNAFVCLKTAGRSVLKNGGLTVLTTAASTGMGEHGLFGPGGLSHRDPGPLRHLRGGDLWLLAPGVSQEEAHAFYWEGYRFFRSAEELFAALDERLSSGSVIGVVPAAPAQQLTFEVDGNQ